MLRKICLHDFLPCKNYLSKVNDISSGFYRIAFAYGYYVVDRINFQTTLQSFLAVGSIFQKG
jgi:CRISPR/Cas system CSM-associated protein Csm4 (group 5 of RAMP superfamily)